MDELLDRKDLHLIVKFGWLRSPEAGVLNRTQENPVLELLQPPECTWVHVSHRGRSMEKGRANDGFVDL